MLTARQRQILKAVIDIYVKTAEPVGSKVLAESRDFKVSSATLRSEMSELIAQGYLEQPHTSAGRVPTHKGYRLYVNELMNAYSLSAREAGELKNALQLKISRFDRLNEEIGRILSQLTNYAALTVTQKLLQSAIRRVDIIRCESFVYVLIVVMGAGFVKSLTVRVFTEPDEDELAGFVTMVNDQLRGLDTDSITAIHMRRLEASAPAGCAELLNKLFAFIRGLAEESGEVELTLRGEGNLLDYPEYRDIDKARELFGFLQGMRSAEWFPMPGDAPLVVRIGEENLAKQLHDSSLMVAGCYLAGGYRGYIGIVGPTRMNYPRLAARLSYFAQGLSSVIKETVTSDDEIPEDDEL